MAASPEGRCQTNVYFETVRIIETLPRRVQFVRLFSLSSDSINNALRKNTRPFIAARWSASAVPSDGGVGDNRYRRHRYTLHGKPNNAAGAHCVIGIALKIPL